MDPPRPAATPAPPPPTDRRPRRRAAREVSSRYMFTPSSSPLSSSSSDPHPHFPASPRHAAHPPPPLPFSKKPHHRPSSTSGDENHNPSDAPLPPIATERRRILRLFQENNADNHPLGKTRPGTPRVCPADRTNATPRLRSVNTGKRARASGSSKPELASLARANPFAREDRKECDETSSENSWTASEADTCSVSSLGGFCDSPLISNCRVRTVSEFRSSMPEAELLPAVSVRRSVDGGLGRQEAVDESSGRLCHRSLSSAMSNCQQLSFNAGKTTSKPPVSLKSYLGTPRTAGPCRPPQSQNPVTGMGLRKVIKAANRQEDVHSLRMLHNCYLQWRFVNAKAQEAVHARTVAAQKSLYGASEKISELRNSVALKRTELEQLRREESLSTIIESQMPYLHEWTILEGDYSSSFSGTVKALEDASVRLPVRGNVKADIKELNEALDSATNKLEALSLCAEKFMSQAEGLEDLSADLARVASREKALIEECGDLLSVAHNLQVTECSLRSQLLQLNRNNVK